MTFPWWHKIQIHSKRTFVLKDTLWSKQSPSFSCYPSIVTRQHGKTKPLDEDVAWVLWGLHCPWHRLRLLSIPSQSWPSPVDHPHSHQARDAMENPKGRIYMPFMAFEGSSFYRVNLAFSLVIEIGYSRNRSFLSLGFSKVLQSGNKSK